MNNSFQTEAIYLNQSGGLTSYVKLKENEIYG